MYYHKKGLFFKSDYVPIEGSREEKLIKCFKWQTQAFARGLITISLIQIVWGLTGLFGLERNPFLECAESGFEWENINMFGDIFPTLHVAAVIMHAAMVIIIFYRFPRLIFYPNSTTFLITEEREESEEEENSDKES